MLGLLAGAAVALQLAAADVTIEIHPDSAVVQARYELAAERDSVRLSLIRLRGVSVTPDPGSGRWLPMTGGGGYWITAYSAQRTAYLRYVVTGDLSRIPVAVPEIPADPAEEGVALRVLGVNSTARLRDGFPRLEPGRDGWAVARLANVPSFVRLPPETGVLSASGAAQTFVVLLVAGSSVAWALYGWRRRRVGAV
ncbi:MAG: hypothetical protein ACE5PT_01615 [Gemmatimonadales bacterium]